MSKTKVYQQWQGVLISKSDPFDQIKTPIPSYNPKPPTAPEENPKPEAKSKTNAFGHPIDDFSVPDTPPVDPSAVNAFGYPTEVAPDDFVPADSAPADDCDEGYPDAPVDTGSDQEPADAPVEAPVEHHEHHKTSKKSK